MESHMENISQLREEIKELEVLVRALVLAAGGTASVLDRDFAAAKGNGAEFRIVYDAENRRHIVSVVFPS